MFQYVNTFLGLQINLKSFKTKLKYIRRASQLIHKKKIKHTHIQVQVFSKSDLESVKYLHEK